MVHDKVNSVSNKSPTKCSPVRSSSRRSSRYRPTARGIPTTKDITQNNLNKASWSTIYQLSLSEQRQLDRTTNNHTNTSTSPFIHGSCRDKYQEAIKCSTSFANSKSEKPNLDKVEDMEVDHQSDHGGNFSSSTSEHPGTSAKGSLHTDSPETSGNIAEIIKEVTKTKLEYAQSKQDRKKGKFQYSSKGKKNSSEMAPGSKVVKKKPIYIILHAALVRVGGITGKALSPVRIQAERILIQMEIKSDSSSEMFTLRVPCKELVAVQANLSEPPFLLSTYINKDYTKNLLNGSKKNGILNKLKGVDVLEIVIQLTYDNIPKDVKLGLDMLRKDFSEDVRWKEIRLYEMVCNSSQARDILNGKECKDIIDGPDEKRSPLMAEKKVLKVRGNRKKDEKSGIENRAGEETTQPKAKSDEEGSLISPNKPMTVKRESNENSVCLRETSLEEVINHRRKRTYDETEHLKSLVNSKTLEEKAEGEPEKDETLERNRENSVASQKDPRNPSQSDKDDQFRLTLSEERSFEENRLNARRLSELETIIAEKEGLLNQRRIAVELRELQLEQERNTVRELRGTLREEQTMRRDLEARYEALNGQLHVRNALADSRVQEMERELSQLNISVTDLRTENQRLAEEINEFRCRVERSEEIVNAERNTTAILREDLERNRATLERLRQEIQQKDTELERERDLRAEAVEMRNQLERNLASTTEEYEERLRRSDEERARLSRRYEECNQLFVATTEQIRSTSSALRRAQETIDEYSRMQPRDWTIPRDEIEISEKMLGQGGWGWVKEGIFRGTTVAVKQMHELIVSPHNRRLFEREMQMAARCRHPNLLQFIGATNDDDLPLLVTELLDTNLRAVLGQRSLCQDEVLTISVDVSKALNYLHLNKPFPIIHRDISSTNVLLWKRENAWHAKLSDYGAANFMRQCMTVSPGASIYAAPEVVTSRQSTKVDVFSFGLLLCEMCIRELPVPQQTNDQVRLITSGHLRDLVQRCVNETPDQRPMMHEVLSALLHLWSSTTLGTVSVNSRQVVI